MKGRNKMVLFGMSTLILLVLFYCAATINLIAGAVMGVAFGVALTLFIEAAEDYRFARRWGVK